MSIDVSVIIAAYNIAPYIEEAVGSVLSQDDIHVEIIVVDDQSNDKTWSILQDFTDPRIKIFQLSQNGGPSAARNKAIDEANGEWIAVLDGDDRFLPERLKTLKALGEKLNSDIVIDNLMIFEEDTGVQRPMFDRDYLKQINPLTLAHYINGNLFQQSAQHTLGYTKPFIRRSFLQTHALRYNPDIRIGEDYDFMARALVLGAKCHTHSEAGYAYRVRSGSISHRLTPKDMERVQTIDGAFKADYGHMFDKDSQKAQSKRDRSIKDIYAFTVLVEGIKDKNLKKIGRSFRLSPFACRHLKDAIFKRLLRK